MKLPLIKKKRTVPSKRPSRFVSTVKRRSVGFPVRPLSAFLITFLTILSLYLLFRSDIFLIREIQLEKEPVEKNYVEYISEDMIREETVFWSSYSLLRFPLATEQERLQNKFTSLEYIQIKKELPDKVIVAYKERAQVAIIRASNGDFVVDETGFIFSDAIEGIEAPVFEDLEHAYNLKDHLKSERVTFALDVVQKLDALAISSQNFTLVNIHDVSVKTKEETEILFSDLKNLDIQIATLKILLENASQKQQVLKKIDLRFERPVIVE